MGSLRFSSLVVLAAITSISLAYAQSARLSPSEPIREVLPSVILADGSVGAATLSSRLPQTGLTGASIAYVHDGKIQWAEGYGLTTKGGNPVDRETVFQAASISKTLTAACVLGLVAAGKLDLDADVARYLKTWRIPTAKFSGTVTLRKLLTHTAGFNIHGFLGYPSDAHAPTLLQVLNGQSPSTDPSVSLESAPGERFSYSGGGYLVVQLILEEVTGQPFFAVLRDNVLKPLHMSRSSFDLRLPTTLKANSAVPYQSNGVPWRGGAYIYPQSSAAGLWSTPTDLAKFVIALQDSLAAKPGSFLPQHIAKQMMTPEPQSEAIGVRHGDVENGYGLGLLVGRGDHPFFYHEGWTAGFTSELFAYQRGDAVVVMTNGDAGDRLVGDILRTVADKYDWPNLKPASLPSLSVSDRSIENFQGFYRTDGGSIVSIFAKGPELYLERIGRAPFRLLPKSENSFLMSGFYLLRGEVTFSSSSVPVNSLAIKQNEETITATRIAESDPSVGQMRAILSKVAAASRTVGTQEALLALMAQITTNSFDLAKVETRSAKIMQDLLPKAQADLRKLGAVRQVEFQAVNEDGTDVYLVKYAKGWAIWNVGLTSDNRLFGVSYRLQ